MAVITGMIKSKSIIILFPEFPEEAYINGIEGFFDSVNINSHNDNTHEDIEKHPQFYDEWHAVRGR